MTDSHDSREYKSQTPTLFCGLTVMSPWMMDFMKYSAGTNQHIFQEVRAQHKLILSDLLPSFLLETSCFQVRRTAKGLYPEMHRVNLTEAVRSTQRVVFGANAFQLLVQLQDGELTTCGGTTGPPLKSFILWVLERYDHDLFAPFSDNTVKAPVVHSAHTPLY